MSGRSELAAVHWLWRFCSPFAETPALPAPDAWADIFKVADRHLVLPRLALGLLPRRDETGDAVADFLEAALELCRYRNDRLRRQLLTFCRAFNAVGIEPILLKGAPFLLAHDASRYRRMMLDIDIWVPDPAQQEQAIRCLHDLGYAMREDPATSTHSQHYPPFFHDGEIARVELHRDMVHSDFAGLLDQPAIAAAACPQHRDGIGYRLPDDRSALALSYLQCRRDVGTDKGYVTMMKWLDCLDRVHRMGLGPVRDRADLGLFGAMEDADRLALTAFNDWGGLPYEGARDERFIGLWERSYRQSVVIRYVKNVFGAVFMPRRWRDMTGRGLVGILRRRFRNLPSYLRRAGSRDMFGS